MDQQQQSRWRPTKRQVLWTVGIVVAMVVAFIYLGYVREWRWTGFVKDKDFSKKTLWDWLDLLIVPVVLALGGYLFTRSENSRTQEIAEEQRTLDREIADERRQDDMLQAYVDGMSQLLTDEKRPLHRAQLGDSLSTVARARTLPVLRRLDGSRKGSVMQFLYESGLITWDRGIVDLKGADLRGADLHGADLSTANLGFTNLSRADLGIANLKGASLIKADLMGADLIGANLRMANLFAADLRGAKLGRTNLIEADLSMADLMGAILIKADLRGANLSVTMLGKAILNGADLRHANGVTNDHLKAVARSLKGATMPNGQKYEEWLKDKEDRREVGENSGST